jgi:hypothetical protein
MKHFVTFARIVAWVLVTGAAWAIIFKLPLSPWFNWFLGFALFAVCYKIQPRIDYLEG